MIDSFSRHHLMSSAAVALSLVAIGYAPRAAAQSFPNQALQGQASTPTPGSVTIVQTATTDTITVNAPQAIINWNPQPLTAPLLPNAPIDFLPAGRTANFINGAGVTDYTVLNRILPADPSTQTVVFNGTVNARIGIPGLPAQTGGSVWFYSPSGIIVGANAAFNVGNLILTADDIVTTGGLFGPAGQIRFAGSATSTVGVTILPNATAAPQINLTRAGSYLAVVAPTIVQGGLVSVNGSAAYIAAQQANVTINAGLFDINFISGAPGPVAITHTGTTTGPAQGGNGQIVFATVAKNQAVSMLLSGTIGYTPAATATVQNGQVILLGGYNGTTAANTTPVDITIGNTSFTSSVAARTTGTLLAAPTGTLQFASNAAFTSATNATLRATNGARITVGGNLTIESRSVDRTTGGAAALIADRAGGAAASVAVSGATAIDASGFGASATQPGIGGTASILVDGSLMTLTGATTVVADGSGAFSTAASGGGIGGTASVTVRNAVAPGSGLTTGVLLIGARGRGGESGYGIDPSGGGTAGNARLDVTSGSLVASDIILDANAFGGDANANGIGGDASAGTARLALGGGTVRANSITVQADETFGSTRTGGTTGRTLGTGVAAIDITGGQLSAAQSLFITASGGGSTNKSPTSPGATRGGTARLNVSTGTLIANGGTTTVRATARSLDTSIAAAFGTATGGTASVAVTAGGNLTLTTLIVDASARGGNAESTSVAALSQSGGAAIGGNAQVTLAGSSGQFNDLLIFGTAMGGNAISRGGNATGGSAQLTISSGTTNAATTFVSASAVGGETFGGNGTLGGDAQAGAAGLSIGGGTANLATITVAANELAGSNAVGGTTGSSFGLGTALLAVSQGTLNLANNFAVTANANVVVDIFHAPTVVSVLRAGSARITLSNGGQFTALGLNNIIAANTRATSGNYGQRPLLPVAETPKTQRAGEATLATTGGTSNLTVSGGSVLNLAALSLDSTARGIDSIGAAGAATGGQATVTIGGAATDASALTISGALAVTADGIGGAGAAGGNGTGGLVALDVSRITTGSLSVNANGYGGTSATAAATGAVGRGGTISYTQRLSPGGATSLGTASFQANGRSAADLTGFRTQGNGGAGFGGAINFNLGQGTLQSSALTASADGRGADGLGSIGFQTASGGTGTGGNIIFNVSGAQVSPGALTLTARGFGGSGTALASAFAASGGNGRGGAIVMALSGGSLIGGKATVDAGGSGGSGGRGNDANGAGGGIGTGGSIGLNANGALITLDSLGLVAGGAGGIGGNAESGYGTRSFDGGTGGGGSGGTVSASLDRGAISIAALTLDSAANGGTGGLGTAGSPTFLGRSGGGGGDATAGIASLHIGAALATPATIALNSRATGGTGGAGEVGGAGGTALGGTASATIETAIVTTGSVTLGADAQGGNAGASVKGAGASGGSATGGNATIAALSNRLTFGTGSVQFTASAGATGGRGGAGGTNNVNATGGNGGIALAGALSLAGTGGAIDLSALASLTLTSIATGGAGGNGGTGAGAGSGGRGTGGVVTLAAADAGGVVTLGTGVGIDTSGFGGVGGNGGSGAAGLGGTNGGNGATGANGISGGNGSAGGAGGTGGDGGIGQGGLVTITAVDGGRLVAGTLTAVSNGTGGTAGFGGGGGAGGNGGSGGNGGAGAAGLNGGNGGVGGNGGGGGAGGNAGAIGRGLGGTVQFTAQGGTIQAASLGGSSTGVQGLLRSGGNGGAGGTGGSGGGGGAAGSFVFPVTPRAGAAGSAGAVGGEGAIGDFGSFTNPSGGSVIIETLVGTDDVTPGAMLIGDVSATVSSMENGMPGNTGFGNIVLRNTGPANPLQIMQFGTLTANAGPSAFTDNSGSITFFLENNPISITGDATIATSGNITINAAGIGGLRTSGLLTVSAGDSLLVNHGNADPATVTLSGGTVLLDASNNIIFDSGARAQADGTLRLLTGNDIVVRNGASLSAGNQLILDAGAVPGNLFFGPDDISTIRVDGTISAPSGFIGLTAEAIQARANALDSTDLFASIRNAPAVGVTGSTDGGQLSTDCVGGNICLGPILATGDVTLGARPLSGFDLPNTIRLTGGIDAGTVYVRSRDTLSFGDPGVPVTISGGGLLFVESMLGDVLLNDASALMTDGDLTVVTGGNLRGANATLDAGNNLFLSLGGSLDLASIESGYGIGMPHDPELPPVPQILIPGSVRVRNFIRAGDGNIDIVAGNGIDIANAESRGNGSVILRALGGNIALMRTAGTGSGQPFDVSLTANTGAISFVDLRADGGLTATAATGIAGGSADAAGSIDLAATAGTIAFTNLAAGLALNVTAPGAVRGTSARARGGNLTIAGRGGIDIGTLFASSNAAATSVGVVRLNGATAGIDLSVSGSTIALQSGQAGRDIIVSSTGTSGSDALFAVPVAAATINATSLTAGRDLRVDGLGDVTLGTASAGGIARIVSALVLNVTTASATGDMFLSGGDSVTIGTATGGRDVEIGSQFRTGDTVPRSRNVTIGSATAGDDLFVSAFGTVNATSLRTTGLGQDGTNGLSGQSANLAGSGIAVGGGTGVSIGTLDARGQASVFNVPGAVGGVAVANGSGGLNIGTANAIGPVILRNQIGAVTATTIASQSSVDVRAGTSAALGTTTAATSIAAQAGSGAIGYAQLTSGGATALTAVTGIIGAGAASAGGALVLTTAGGNIAFTTASAGSTATLTTGGTGSISGTGLTAAGAVAITGPNGIAIPTIASGGTTVLNAANGAIIVSSDLRSVGRVSATGLSILLRSLGTLSAGQLRATAGGIDVQSSGDLIADDSQASAAITLASTNGAITIGSAVTSQALAVRAAGVASITTRASGNSVDIRSTDIAIAPTASVGTAGTTDAVTFVNVGTQTTTIGGTGAATGYVLSNAELSRVFANNIGVTGGTGVITPQTGLLKSITPNVAPLVILDNLTLNGGTAGTIGNGTFTVQSAGKVRVVGTVALTNMTATNRFQITSGDAIEALPTSSITMTGAGGALTGTLALNAPDILAVSPAALTSISTAPDLGAASNLVGANNALPANDQGYFAAGGIIASVSSSLYIQNSGASAVTANRDFSGRRGFTVGAGGFTIVQTRATPIRIAINGRQVGTLTASGTATTGGFVTGIDLIPNLTFVPFSNGAVPPAPLRFDAAGNLVSGTVAVASVFDLQSTVNGCKVAAAVTCRNNFDNGNIARDVIRNAQDKIGDPGLLSIDIVEFKQFDGFIDQPLIDEPVTGAANDDLWSVDDAKCDPGAGEVCK